MCSRGCETMRKRSAQVGAIPSSSLRNSEGRRQPRRHSYAAARPEQPRLVGLRVLSHPMSPSLKGVCAKTLFATTFANQSSISRRQTSDAGPPSSPTGKLPTLDSRRPRAPSGRESESQIDPRPRSAPRRYRRFPCRSVVAGSHTGFRLRAA